MVKLGALNCHLLLPQIFWTRLTFWPFTVTLTLNAVIQLFSQDTLAYDNVSWDQVWLPKNQQFRKYSRKCHILIIWALAVTLTLKIATATTEISAWLSGSRCCITTPNLVTKWPVIQKISSGQTFTDILNLRCYLDLERSNPIFPHDTPAYDTVLSNQVRLQTDQQFRRYNSKSHILIIKALTVTLTLNTVNHFFLHVTLAYDAA